MSGYVSLLQYEMIWLFEITVPDWNNFFHKNVSLQFEITEIKFVEISSAVNKKLFS